jgi:hypothetical protein
MSPSWRLEFWAAFYIFGKCVGPSDIHTFFSFSTFRVEVALDCIPISFTLLRLYRSDRLA